MDIEAFGPFRQQAVIKELFDRLEKAEAFLATAHVTSKRKVLSDEEFEETRQLVVPRKLFNHKRDCDKGKIGRIANGFVCSCPKGDL